LTIFRDLVDDQMWTLLMLEIGEAACALTDCAQARFQITLSPSKKIQHLPSDFDPPYISTASLREDRDEVERK